MNYPFWFCVGIVVGNYSYEKFLKIKLLQKANRRLDYLEATDRCLEQVKINRKHLKEKGVTISELESHCEFVGKLYTNCLSKNKCTYDDTFTYGTYFK